MLAGFHYSAHIEEFAADLILVKRTSPKPAVALIVQNFPEATGLDVIFALTSIAGAVRIWRPKDRFEKDLPTDLFEACAMLGADLFALEKLGIHPASCRAILEYWGEGEVYFK